MSVYTCVYTCNDGIDGTQPQPRVGLVLLACMCIGAGDVFINHCLACGPHRVNPTHHRSPISANPLHQTQSLIHRNPVVQLYRTISKEMPRVLTIYDADLSPHEVSFVS